MNKTGENIRKLRVLHSFSQEYMAVNLGMSQGNYARMESGEGGISEKRLTQIAVILGCSTEFIANFDPEKLSQHADPNNGKAGLLHFNISAELKELYESRINILETQLEHLRNKLNITTGKKADPEKEEVLNTVHKPDEIQPQMISKETHQTQNAEKAQIFKEEAQFI